MPTVPSTVEAVIHGVVDGVQIANVLHFRTTGVVTIGEMQDLADLVDTNVADDYLPIMNLDVTYVETVVTDLSAIPPSQVFSSAGGGTGGNATASLPANCTLCVTARTAHIGRSYRGRFYGFPIGSSEQSGVNGVTSGYATALAAFLNQLRIDAAVIGWTNVVLSRVQGGVTLAIPVTTPIVIWEARNLLLDSQRRRLPHGH